MHQISLIEDDIYSNGFHIIDNFMSPSHYHALQNMADDLYSQNKFRAAKIGQKLEKNENLTVRSDKIHWLDEHTLHPAARAYFDAINSLAMRLNQSLFLGLNNFETHFAIYQPGDFYKKHVDQFATTKDRKISCVYYLNQEWCESDGGELVLYDRNERQIKTILPTGNRLLCFNSELPHEVSVTKKTRYSLAGWLKIRS